VHDDVVVPLQVPAQAVPSVAQAGLPPVGAPVTGEQVPALPETVQEPHCPVQAVSQQTPSTQLPEAHWSAAVQAVPLVLSETHLLVAVSQ
jgi:hypothetical protein